MTNKKTNLNAKSAEMMKKLIEAKRNKGAVNGGQIIPTKSMGEKRKGHRNNKGGGMFDK